MRLSMVFAVLVSLAAVGVTRAEVEEGEIAPDIEAKEWLNLDYIGATEGPSLADLRGMIVVLYFWDSFNEFGERILPQIATIEGNDRIGRQRGVFILGVCKADRERIEEGVRKNKIFFPVALESDAQKEYDINSPGLVIIDAEGKLYWSTDDSDSGDSAVEQIQKAMVDTPPTRTHPYEALLVDKFMTEAHDKILGGEYRQAISAARKASEHALTGDLLKTKCQEYVDLLEAIGSDYLSRGERLIEEKKFDQGVEQLRVVAFDFRGADCSRRARLKLNELAKDHDEVNEILVQLRKDGEAVGVLAEALDNIQSRMFAEAYTNLERLTTEYKGTGSAEDAAGILERMKKFPAIRGEIRDFEAQAECEPKLARARNLLQRRRYRQAAKVFKEIIEKYPETSYAEKARQAMINMP